MSVSTSGGLSKFIAVLLMMLVVAALYFGAAVPVWDRYQSNTQEMSRHRDHLARFAGLAARIDELLTEVEALEEFQSATPYTLPEESENLAAASLQERIKVIVGQNGARLKSTQVLPGTSDGRFTRVSVNVRLTGDSESLKRILYHVESGSPYLIVDNLAIRARNVRRQIVNQDGSRAVKERVEMEILMKVSGFIRDEPV